MFWDAHNSERKQDGHLPNLSELFIFLVPEKTLITNDFFLPHLPGITEFSPFEANKLYFMLYWGFLVFFMASDSKSQNVSKEMYYFDHVYVLSVNFKYIKYFTFSKLSHSL